MSVIPTPHPTEPILAKALIVAFGIDRVCSVVYYPFSINVYKEIKGEIMDQRKRKTVQINDSDMHKKIKMLAAEKGVTIEAIIKSGIEMLLKEEKAVK